MSFTRDDLVSYESKPQVQVEKHDPWEPLPHQAGNPPPKEAEADVNAAIDTSVSEPTVNGDNDGSSTTDNLAEPVAVTPATPEGDKDPNELDDLADGRPRSRAQERIEELVAERNALRKYGEYLLAQVEATRKAPTQQAEPQVSQTRPAESKEDPAPTLEDAEFDPVKHTKLQNEWLNRQVAKQVDQAVRQIESRQSEVATRQAFENRTAEFRKNAPDFDIVIANPQLPALAPEAARVVVRSDEGPAIAYHLGKNPDLAVRISRMEPVSQAAAIGRLEEQLVRARNDASSAKQEPSKKAEPAQKPVAVSKAPPPPKPVSPGSGLVQKDASLMSMEEWVANERSQRIAAKQARLKMRSAMR